MPLLTAQQLASLRSDVARGQIPVTWDKTQINAALQAIEDWFESNRAALNTAINAATAPFVFPAGIKRLILLFFLTQKAGRE